MYEAIARRTHEGIIASATAPSRAGAIANLKQKISRLWNASEIESGYYDLSVYDAEGKLISEETEVA